MTTSEKLQLFTSIISCVISAIALYSIKQNNKLSKIALDTNHLSVVLELFKEYRSIEFKEHQDFIFTELDKYPPEVLSKLENQVLKREILNHMRFYSHFADNLGLLVRSELIDKEELIYMYMGDSLIHGWSKLKPHIMERRRLDELVIKGKRMAIYQECFEELVTKMIAYKEKL